MADQLRLESLKDENPESKARCAVSRYYYGAFCFTKDCLVSIRQFNPSANRDDHADVRTSLEQKGKSTLRKAAEHLRSLYKDRCRCDYDGTVDRSWIDMANDASAMASFIVREVTQYRNECMSRQSPRE